MIPFKETFESQQAFFIKHSIRTNNPGFYDDSNFLELEYSNPAILNNYASFVKQQKYDENYLKMVEEKLPIICNILYEELLKDKRQGACIDMSMALSRILEREKIWNYAVKGSLTITFPKESGIRTKYFWTIDQGEFAAAHAWLVVPPFKIVDLSIKEQPYKQQEKQFLPDTILQKQTKISEVDLKDVIEPNILLYLKKINQNNNAKIMSLISNDMTEFLRFFVPEIFENKDTIFKYTPVGIAAADVLLEDLTGLKLSGMYPQQIYEELIKPKLR
jgi:hypothetical protein